MNSRIVSLLVVVAVLAGWEVGVDMSHANRFVIVAPSVIARQLVLDWPLLAAASWFTLKIMWQALLLALVSGVGLAFLVERSKAMEAGILPIAIALQVTPVVAIAPILLVWAGPEAPERALLACAWIVTFFPILAAQLTALRQIPTELRDIFALHRARFWHRLWLLELPASLPGLLAGLKIASGLALIGAVVAEFAIGGIGDSSGLAWVLAQATKQLEMARAFASLALLTGIGIIHYLLFSTIEAHILHRRGILR